MLPKGPQQNKDTRRKHNNTSIRRKQQHCKQNYKQHYKQITNNITNNITKNFTKNFTKKYSTGYMYMAHTI